MDTRTAYNNWAEQYDTNENKTRDLEATALRQVLEEIQFSHCLEIGCGTGKNTEWLSKRAAVLGVDLSEEMLARAREKHFGEAVRFEQADVTVEWNFRGPFDLVSFSLVLEHIENLDHIFLQAARVLTKGGHLYLGELHPYKQYSGSKARFQTEKGEQVVNCYTHHLTDFTDAARQHGLRLVNVAEYFDDNDRSGTPRILALLFQKA